MEPIDIVIPWVDGSDPAWRAEKAQYRADTSSDNSEARFREWDLFRYWFRAVEKNAPWVRKIHLITWGHLPPWLREDHPKLHIVNHRDYIPEEFLPTFSSHTIELNMHRIPGLSEQFLYFNDDVYLMKPSRPEDFFRQGLPVDAAVMGVIKNPDFGNFMPYIMLNMLAVINHSFSKRKVIRANPGKWFSLAYGKQNLNNLYLLPWGAFTGFRNFHTCVPFLKGTLEEVWAQYPEVLSDTCRRKFRSREDVNQYLFRYWQLCKGTFVPGKPDSAYLTVGRQSVEEVAAVMKKQAHQVLCINDDPIDFDFETQQRGIAAAFQELFPEKSSFEREN